MAIIDFCCKDITVSFESDGVMDEEWVAGGCWRLDEVGWLLVVAVTGHCLPVVWYRSVLGASLLATTRGCIKIF